MSKVKYNLPTAISKQLDQGQKVATMAGEVMTGNAQVAALVAANTDLASKNAAMQEARQAATHATTEVKASARAHRQAYNDVGNDVQTESSGDAIFITSTGFSVRATPQGSPVLAPPVGLRTRITGHLAGLSFIG